MLYLLLQSLVRSVSSFLQRMSWSSHKHISSSIPGIKGFNRRGLYRMKKFYETYKDNEIVTPLVTQISWTNHLLIMSGCKTDEEREFYIRLCIKENYSKASVGETVRQWIGSMSIPWTQKVELFSQIGARKSGQKTVRTFLIYSQMTVELFTSFRV